MAEHRKSNDEPMTVADLRGLACETPGCTSHAGHKEAMILVTNCHPRQGLLVEYRAGILTTRCRVCKRFIGAFKIAADDGPASLVQ